MKILVTGCMGYVGPVVTRHLRARLPDAELVGFDAGYFAHCLTDAARIPEIDLVTQHFGDIRELPASLLRGVDAVVHLAAISNDPMGNRFEAVTEEINHRASVRLAELARDAGVASFVFASSCSMYGAAAGAPRREGDPLNPLSAYARSKAATEAALAAGEWGDMTVTCLRFSTACGMSPRLRLDLVLNDFVAGAVSTGRITVLSDGSPWRPLIDVTDMARAIEWAIGRTPAEGGALLQVNVGSQEWNYQVKDLARAVQHAIPGTTVSISSDAPPDTRSYQVDFALYRELAPRHQPAATLEQSIGGLVTGLGAMGFRDDEFRQSGLMRLRVLEGHMTAGRLTAALRWR